MKRFLTGFCAAALLGAVLSGCGGTPQAQAAPAAGMDMDEAIKEAAAQMEAKIPQGTMVALVSVASPSTAFSEQALTRLESAIVSSGELVVVDRANLDKVRAEQGFQMSGEVDDESAKKIGGLLGAGAIVTGGLADLGDVYSLTFKAINMETATVAVSYLADLAKTTRVETLLASGGGAGGTAASGGQAAAKPAAPAGPKNGTYTFYPRLQAYQGAGLQDRVYISKITVRGEFMSIYLTDSAEGPSNQAPHGYWTYNTTSSSQIVLQSLDNPALSYNPENIDGYSYDNDNTGYWLTFKGVKFTRFSLTNNRENVPGVFEEIVLGEPDAR